MMSGIQTKGVHNTQIWVQAFQIKYSNDKIIWITIKDDNKGMISISNQILITSLKFYI